VSWNQNISTPKTPAPLNVPTAFSARVFAFRRVDRGTRAGVKTK